MVPNGEDPFTLGAEAALAGEPLSIAIIDLRERLRTAGPLPEGDDGASLQWRLLRGGCAARGRLFPRDEARWTGARGGSEHRCRFIESLNRWEKLTLANRAGWWVDPEGLIALPATPLQYLERLQLVNEIFADDSRFVGLEVGAPGYSCSMATTQPHVLGVPPPLETIRAWFGALGFSEVSNVRVGANDAQCFRRDDLWAFDVRPMNFVQFGSDLFPIDVILQRIG